MPLFLRSMGRACALALVVVGAAACGDNPAGPEPAGSGSAAPGAANNQVKKPDPVVTKVFKAEACYYGALSMKLAKAAYTESLGGAEPSADKIPDFGAAPMDATPPAKDPRSQASASASAGASAAPVGSGKPAAPAGSAKPATTAKPTAAPTAKVAAAPTTKPSAQAAAPSGSARTAPPGSAGAAPGRDAAAMAKVLPVPYERFVRACHVAAGNVKDLPAPELDTALKEFSDYALPLSKLLAEANAYYQKEEYKQDSFAKGKDYHQKITAGFAKLDETLKKVEDGLTKFKAQNAIDTTAYTESQKLSEGVTKASIDVLVKMIERPWNPAAVKTEVDKLEAAMAPFRKYADEHKEDRDPWVMLVQTPGDNFVKHVRALVEADPAEVKVGKIVNAVTLFNRVHEGNNRALARKLAEGAGKASLNNRNLRPKLPPRGTGPGAPAPQ